MGKITKEWVEKNLDEINSLLNGMNATYTIGYQYGKIVYCYSNGTVSMIQLCGTTKEAYTTTSGILEGILLTQKLIKTN